MNTPLNIIIAGGKTGGHLFPGIAIAQALEKKRREIDILFVGTNTCFETQTLKQYGYSHKSIIARPIKGGNIITKAFSISIIAISLIQAIIIIKSIKPDFVLGVGGFSSFAIVLAACFLKIPNAIHEQNSISGMTNRMLSKFVNTIFTSFEKTKGFVTDPKIKCFGNPVRRTQKINSNNDMILKDIDQNKFTILVTGGSQGAKSINNAFMNALALMDDAKEFNIIHQTGISDEQSIQEKYNQLEIKAITKAFFYNMPQLLDMADLVITRAGAGTISELTIKGLPAILVPFPYAADDHQTYNAMALEQKGAAVMINDKELTGKTLKQSICALIKDKTRLDKMAKTLKQLAMPDADKKIAAFILKDH